MLGLQNEREWVKLCSEVLRKPTVATDPRFNANTLRVENQEELKEIIYEVFSELTAPELLERLESAGIANAQLREMSDVWEHPQLLARGRWVEVDTPEGPVPALIPPGFDKSKDYRMGAVPCLGEHNSKIFTELGIEA